MAMQVKVTVQAVVPSGRESEKKFADAYIGLRDALAHFRWHVVKETGPALVDGSDSTYQAEFVVDVV